MTKMGKTIKNTNIGIYSGSGQNSANISKHLDNIKPLNLILMDQMGALIGQASAIKHKKSKLVYKTTTARQQDPQGRGPTLEMEQIEPVIISIPPGISDSDIQQTMIFLYDSVR